MESDHSKSKKNLDSDDKSIIKLVFETTWYAWWFPKYAMVALLSLVVLALITIGAAFFIKEAFDLSSEIRDGYFYRLIWAFGILGVLELVFWQLRAWSLSKLSGEVGQELRDRLFRFFEGHSTKELSSISLPESLDRYSKHVENIEKFFQIIVPRLLLASLKSFFCIIYLLILEWRLALLAIILGALSTLGPNLTSSYYQKATARAKDASQSLLETLQDVLSLSMVIRAFRLENYWRGKFEDRTQTLKSTTISRGYWNIFSQGIMLCSISITQYIMIFCGVLSLHYGNITIGGLVAFLTLLISLSDALTVVGENIPDTFQTVESTKQIRNHLGEKQGSGETTKTSLPPLEEKIAFQKINFGYQENQKILRDISMTIPHNNSVAFVGSSGSGKSTMLGVVMGFNQPQSGEVFWDERGYSTFDTRSLLGHCGPIFQDTTLFNLSVRDNILMGRLDANEEEVFDAARAAEIHTAILRMPDGYDTQVGLGGKFLSGGQRQRIAIARALLKNPNILLLDESTSALDPEAEFLINETLDKLRKDRTVISRWLSR